MKILDATNRTVESTTTKLKPTIVFSIQNFLSSEMRSLPVQGLANNQKRTGH